MKSIVIALVPLVVIGLSLCPRLSAQPAFGAVIHAAPESGPIQIALGEFSGTLNPWIQTGPLPCDQEKPQLRWHDKEIPLPESETQGQAYWILLDPALAAGWNSTNLPSETTAELAGLADAKGQGNPASETDVPSNPNRPEQCRGNSNVAKIRPEALAIPLLPRGEGLVVNLSAVAAELTSSNGQEIETVLAHSWQLIQRSVQLKHPSLADDRLKAAADATQNGTNFGAVRLGLFFGLTFGTNTDRIVKPLATQELTLHPEMRIVFLLQLDPQQSNGWSCRALGLPEPAVSP